VASLVNDNFSGSEWEEKNDIKGEGSTAFAATDAAEAKLIKKGK